MKKLPWILLAIAAMVIVFLVGIALILLSGEESSEQSSQSSVNELLEKQSENNCGLPSAASIAAVAKIEVGDEGFSPDQVSVKVGQTVQWQNTGKAGHQVASDAHPAHAQCVGMLSDELPEGGEFQFTFTKPGTWYFHDESNLSHTGSVKVTE